MTEDLFHLGVKALLRNDKGKILLLQVNPAKLNGEQKDYWDLPGGRIQKGASVTDTLRREVEEETGIIELHEPKEIAMVLSNIRVPLGSESAGLILDIYSCGTPPGTTIKLSDEHIAHGWFAPAEAAKLLQVKYPDKFCKVIAEL